MNTKMAGNSQQETERETRFAHLLKPIRDLADNWDVDVAAELMEYLEELNEIEVELEDGHTNLNFAEAALLIQGSTMVYTKKVEFLHALVFETMRLVTTDESSGNKRGRRRSSIGTLLGADDLGDGDSDGGFDDDEPQFLLLDDNIVTADNIDLKNNHSNTVGSRERNGNRNNENENDTTPSSTNLLVTLPLPLRAVRPDLFTANSALRTLSCRVLASGALALEPENIFVNGPTSNSSTTTNSADGEFNPVPTQLDFTGAEDEQDQPLEAPDMGGNDDDDFSDGGGGGGGGFDSWGECDDPVPDQPRVNDAGSMQQRMSTRNGGHAQYQGDDEDDEEEDEEEWWEREGGGVDPWERLDPHTASSCGRQSATTKSTVARAFKRGKTFRVPDVLLHAQAAAAAATGGGGGENKKSKRLTVKKKKKMNGICAGGFILGGSQAQVLQLTQWMPYSRLEGGVGLLSKVRPGGLFMSEFAFVLKQRMKRARIEALAKAKRTRTNKAARRESYVQQGGGLDHNGNNTNDIYDALEAPDWGASGGYDDDGGGGDYDDSCDGGGGGMDMVTSDDLGPIESGFGAADVYQYGASIDSQVLKESSASYEDLVRQHVEKYLQSANTWATGSSLHRRVKEWQDRVEPILNMQDHHPAFDIHSYGDIILLSLNSSDHHSDECDDDDDDEYIRSNGHGSSDFVHVAAFIGPERRERLLDNGEVANSRGVPIRASATPWDSQRDDSDSEGDYLSDDENNNDQKFQEEDGGEYDDDGKARTHYLERFEVCRLFLASLQLANNGNVELAHDEADDKAEDMESLVVDNSSGLRVRLLTSMLANKRLEGYRAPSARGEMSKHTVETEEGEENANSSQKRKKNKSNKNGKVTGPKHRRKVLQPTN